MPKLVWRVKLVAELVRGSTTDMEVARQASSLCLLDVEILGGKAGRVGGFQRYEQSSANAWGTSHQLHAAGRTETVMSEFLRIMVLGSRSSSFFKRAALYQSCGDLNTSASQASGSTLLN